MLARICRLLAGLLTRICRLLPRLLARICRLLAGVLTRICRLLPRRKLISAALAIVLCTSGKKNHQERI